MSDSERKTFEPFVNSGEATDEIVLKFNRKKLYVSENFLGYASPVFQAMFKHDFKESETRTVLMKGKSYEDFLEFLLCLHPAVQKPIDYDNVLRIVCLAEEYQVESSVTKCKKVMKDMLTRGTENEMGYFKFQDEQAAVCLKILSKASTCGYEDVTSYAITSIARFGYRIFTGTIAVNEPSPMKTPSFPYKGIQQQRSLTYNNSVNQRAQCSQNWVLPHAAPAPVQFPTNEIPLHMKIADPIQECKKMFQSLPEEIKVRLLMERLQLCDRE